MKVTGGMIEFWTLNTWQSKIVFGKGHCVVEETSTLNLLIPNLKKELMFCTTYVQTLYREVQVLAVSRLSHALPNNGIKKSMCCGRDRKLVHKWLTITCGEISCYW